MLVENRSKLHEVIKLQGAKIAQRKICTKGQFCMRVKKYKTKNKKKTDYSIKKTNSIKSY